jgi:hypothetical protein
MKWYKNEFEESYYLEKENGRLVCGIHPKPTREYAIYLGKKYFENNRDFNYWYTAVNFWYGEIAPIDMSDKELINRIMQMEYSVYI